MSRYELEELIGYGGMAEVWRGWRLVADGSRERVAIKRILPCHAREPEAVARFDREARLARAVRHEHIVKAVDYVPEGDERWLVMEHLEGLSLRELRERVGRLPHELLRGIANHVLDALRYLHGRSILHRDISPSNIMLTRSGEVLLLDLGLFKDLTSGTHSVVFKGTPAYASWEALRGEELAPSSDLYSVAAVFFELLVGELPYGQGPPDRVALYQFSSNPFEKLPDDVPDDFRVLFEGLLTRRETRSFHGAQEVLTVMAYFGEKYEVAEAPEIAAVVEEAMAAQPPVAAVALAKGSGPRRTERMSPSAMAPQQGIAVAVEPPGDEPQAESEAAAVAVLADKQLSSMASTPISDRPWLHRMAAVAALVLFVAGIGLWYGVHQGEAVAIDFFAEQEGQP